VNCDDVRLALGAEPGRRTPELEAHLAACEACAREAAELARLDATIRRALEISVPAAGVRARRALRPRRWLALAASVAGVALLSAALWSFYPREALASALVAHMRHEPQAWANRAVLPQAEVAAVLARSGVELAPGAAEVSYVQSCWFRGRHVPHLVVRTGDGPMTVLLLPREHVAAQTLVDEGGYRVLIVPAAHGAIAILTQGPVESGRIEALRSTLAAAVRFSD
jgi:hypothetical protein